MSHSTHVGFNAPEVVDGPTALPSRPFTGTVPFAIESPVSLSRLVGVGHKAAVLSRWCVCGIVSPAAQRAAISGLPDLPASSTVGVGHDPDPVPPVRGADGACRNAVPFRVIPERGQSSEDSPHASSPSQEPWDVLHEDVSGS
jgi:hypothetical protein